MSGSSSGIDPTQAHELCFGTGPPLSIIYRAGLLLIFAFVATMGGRHGDMFAYVLAAIAVLLAARSLTQRVRATHELLRIRNLLRSYRIPWDQITSFRYVEKPLYWFGAGIGLKRHRVVAVTENKSITIAATQSLRGGLISERVFGDAATKRYLSALEQVHAAN